VLCKECGQEYIHPRLKSDQSTSTQIKHIRKHEPLKKKLSTAGTINQFIQSTSSRTALTKDELETLLLHTMAACNWSFNQFNTGQFQYFISKTTNHSCPGAKRMTTLLERAAQEARDEIRCRLGSCTSRINLALDCWASSNSYNFMGMNPRILHVT